MICIKCGNALVPHMYGIGYFWLPTPQAADGIFCEIQRPIYLKVGAYRILSNQGIDGGAVMKDIALNLWGGFLNPQYVEAMMGFPQNWTKDDSINSETLSFPKLRNGSVDESSKPIRIAYE